MKFSEIREKAKTSYFDFVEIRKNPGDILEYIALLHGRDGKSYMLCHEDDRVYASGKLEDLVGRLKQVGFREAKIYF